VQIAAGRRITPRLDALLLANYNRVTETYDQGSLLGNVDGDGKEAGLQLRWHVDAALDPRLSATRTVAVKNGLDGNRVTLSVVRSFEP
jgi:hypothetical protein